MIFLICVIAQWGTDNIEAKCFHPEIYLQHARAESTHAYDVLKYELDVTVPMTNRSIEGINRITCRIQVDGRLSLGAACSVLLCCEIEWLYEGVLVYPNDFIMAEIPLGRNESA